MDEIVKYITKEYISQNIKILFKKNNHAFIFSEVLMIISRIGT